jgi:hypothetical protein
MADREIADAVSWPSDVSAREIAHHAELATMLERAKEHANTINLNQLLELLQILTLERKELYEALRRVQGRCTDIEMERRKLVDELKHLREISHIDDI